MGVEASKVSHCSRKAATALSAAGCCAAVGLAREMVMDTVLLTAMGLVEGDREGVGEGVAPGALRVVEGLGVLVALGRLVPESEG